MSKRWDVFISHAFEDKERFVRPLARSLAKLGVEVWYDEFTLKLGESISTAIDKGLANSKFGLVIISKAFMSKSKKWAKRELQGLVALNIASKTVILPVLLGVSHKDVLRFSAPLAETVSLTVGGMTAEQVALQIIRERPDIYRKTRGRDREFVERSFGTRLSKRKKPISADSEDRRLPITLTSKGFAYPKPKWLTESQRSSLSEMAKAAFVLLLFEQTETGCWSKSYMRYLSSRGDKLPLSGGALSGTPFALMAISSYAGVTHTSAGGLEPDLVFDHLVEKIEELLQPDGSYLRFEKGGVPGPDQHSELARHAAGACLIRNLYGEAGVRDQKTLKWLCNQAVAINYDRAVVSRLFSQVPYLNSIPQPLQLRVRRSRDKLLNSLLLKIESESGTRFVPPSSDMRHDVINQWSTVWYVLPLLTVSTLSPDFRDRFISRLRQFLFAQSAADPSGTDLLAREIDNLGKAIGKTLFGSGVSLLAWRTLELHAPDNRKYSMQAQKSVHRLINSILDVIDVPTSNPSPDNPESYLGWGAACFAAASVGVQMSSENYRTAVALNEELKGIDVSNRTAQKLKTRYRKAIGGSRLVSPELIGHVARAVATIATNYEPVRKAQTRLSRHSKGR
jgi:hypothetical protein